MVDGRNVFVGTSGEESKSGEDQESEEKDSWGSKHAGRAATCICLVHDSEKERYMRECREQ